MIEDPIVEEIHRYRREHAAVNGNDLDRIVATLREYEQASGRKYVNLEPKRIPAQRVSEVPETYSVQDD